MTTLFFYYCTYVHGSGLVIDSLTTFLENVLMYSLKNLCELHRDFLSNLVLLYIMLAYLMLFAALFNGVCLHSAYFIAIDICKCF